jgi:hypothetical protein
MLHCGSFLRLLHRSSCSRLSTTLVQNTGKLSSLSCPARSDTKVFVLTIGGAFSRHAIARPKVYQKNPWTLFCSLVAWSKDPALGCKNQPQLHSLSHMRATHFALCAAKIVAITFFRNDHGSWYSTRYRCRPCTPRVPIVNRYPQGH